MRGKAVELDALEPFLPFTGAVRATRETSLAAAEAMAGKAATLRALVYRTLKDIGPGGLTDDELQVHLGMDGSTERPRRVELLQQGLIEASDAQRKTRSGRLATVWVVSRLEV